MIRPLVGVALWMCVSVYTYCLYSTIVTCSVECGLMYSLLCHSPSPATPLTFDNLYSVLEEVKGEWRSLSAWFGVYDVASGQYDSDEAALKDVVERYLQHEHNRRTWGNVIWGLDEIGKVHVADKIMSFAEPVQGGCGYLFTVLCVLVTGGHNTVCVCEWICQTVVC